jgi:hypothetical protein
MTLVLLKGLEYPLHLLHCNCLEKAHIFLFLNHYGEKRDHLQNFTDIGPLRFLEDVLEVVNT